MIEEDPYIYSIMIVFGLSTHCSSVCCISISVKNSATLFAFLCAHFYKRLKLIFFRLGIFTYISPHLALMMKPLQPEMPL